MVTRAALVPVALALVACSGSSSDDGSTTTAPTAASTDTSVVGSPDTTVPTAPVDVVETVTDGTVAATPTTELPSGAVEYEGSIAALLMDTPEAERFASGVAAWLDAVPGQDGVLRNARGITLFVPVDDGFDEAAAEAAFADPDASAATIGDHLRVGVLADLAEVDEPITVASGAVYDVEPGPIVGGRAVVASIVATNGVIHLLDGPLPGG